MNELNVVVNQTPGVIECNFDEIEEALKVQMTAYADLEITEESIPERKKDLQVLRKIRGAVDDERKRQKKTFTAPLDEFESKVKKLTGIIDAEIKRINDGLTVFEEKRIAEKQEHIKSLYQENIGDLAEYLPLEKVRSDKWNNKTCSDNEIITSIQEQTVRVKSDLAAIKALNSEFEDKLLAAYKASGNQLATAIQKNSDYMEAKRATEQRMREEAERKAKEEAERKAREEEESRRVNEEAERKAASEAAWNDKEQTPTANVAPTMPEPVSVRDEPTLTVKVKGEKNIEALRGFLAFNEIEFEEV